MGEDKSAADDFYVFIYDEEEKGPQQAKIKNQRGRARLSRSGFTRVIGFWCFNAGIGFNSI